MQDELRDYTRNVIDESWPVQRKGIVLSAGMERITRLSEEFLKFQPAEKREEILFAETLRQFNNFVEVRRARIANVNTALPSVLWRVVAIGALSILACFGYSTWRSISIS